MNEICTRKVVSEMNDPTPEPHVSSIHIAPGSRLPMKPVQEVTLTAGKGLPGDRYENSRHRHVTIQSQTGLDQAAAALGAPIRPSATRRNITISSGSVPDKPGQRMRIGTVQFEVVRIAAPCKLLDDAIGDGARSALRRRAGSVFRVLSGGTIRLQDSVDLLDSHSTEAGSTD